MVSVPRNQFSKQALVIPAGAVYTVLTSTLPSSGPPVCVCLAVLDLEGVGINGV